MKGAAAARSGAQPHGPGLHVQPRCVTGRARGGGGCPGGSVAAWGAGPGRLWRRAARRGQPAHGQRSPPRPAPPARGTGTEGGAGRPLLLPPRRLLLGVSPGISPCRGSRAEGLGRAGEVGSASCAPQDFSAVLGQPSSTGTKILVWRAGERMRHCPSPAWGASREG